MGDFFFFEKDRVVSSIGEVVVFLKYRRFFFCLGWLEVVCFIGKGMYN